MSKTTKSHPILFNASMALAILEGRKTQTRRVIKPQPPICCSGPAATSPAVAGAWPLMCPLLIFVALVATRKYKCCDDFLDQNDAHHAKGGGA